jgi:hypothetical protein
MKKHLVNILIGLLLGAALVFLTSCRTVQRSRSSADSSSVRSEATAERWAREIVTEYIPTSGGLSLPTIQPLPSLYFLPGVRSEEPKSTPIVRQTIRESGEKQVAKTEEKDTAVSQKATERDYSAMIEKAILLGTVFVVLLGLSLLLGVYALFFRKRT